MKPDPETREGKKYQEEVHRQLMKQQGRTPCGYRPGPVQASDGTRYLVTESGQFRRLERKLSKAELKRHKKARRGRNGHAANR